MRLLSPSLPLSPSLIVLGLSLLLSGCSLPGVLAHGVKALQDGGASEPPPAHRIAAPAAQADPQPPPPVAAQRDAVTVETLR